MSSSYFNLRNALLGFPDGHVDHFVFNGLPNIVNGVTGLPFLGEQAALMSNKSLRVQTRADNAALDAALLSGFSGMSVGLKQFQTHPGFPFFGAAAAAAVPVVLPDAKSDRIHRFVGTTVCASATIAGGTVFRTSGMKDITDVCILTMMAEEGAELNVDLDGMPQLSHVIQLEQPEKRSHKAKSKANPMTRRERALPSLRINIQPNPPYSPTTAGGRAVAGGGVGKAKTYSPVTPATAPKQ